MLGTRRAELVDRHAKRRGRAIDVELLALEQLLGNQEGARVAMRVGMCARFARCLRRSMVASERRRLMGWLT